MLSVHDKKRIAEKTAYCLKNGVNPSGSRLSFCEFHADLHCRKNRYTFVPGRKAMTCCADDMQMIGYICKSPIAPQLKHGQWVMVTARVAFEYDKFYRGKGPVLYASKVEPCEPPADEMVYFN